jgi:K+-transporting ATPase ATPase C chain
MDPHIPPRAARLQSPRVARARRVEVARVQALIAAHTELPVLGILGRARVNVLELNLALDEQFGAPAPPLESTATSGQ